MKLIFKSLYTLLILSVIISTTILWFGFAKFIPNFDNTDFNHLLNASNYRYIFYSLLFLIFTSLSSPSLYNNFIRSRYKNIPLQIIYLSIILSIIQFILLLSSTIPVIIILKSKFPPVLELILACLSALNYLIFINTIYFYIYQRTNKKFTSFLITYLLVLIIVFSITMSLFDKFQHILEYIYLLITIILLYKIYTSKKEIL